MGQNIKKFDSITDKPISNNKQEGTHVVVPVEWLENRYKVATKEQLLEFPRINPSQQQKEIDELMAEMESWKKENFDNVDEANKTIVEQQQQIKLLIKELAIAKQKIKELRKMLIGREKESKTVFKF